ncbi:MAG: glycosyltransferase family 10 [Aestuariivirga sp.]
MSGFVALVQRLLNQPQMNRIFTAAQKGAEIRVGILDNWGGIDAELLRFTPHGSCRWGNVAFVPLKNCPQPDFILVLNGPPNDKGMAVNIPPDRLWFASGEPPAPAYFPYHAGQGEFSSVICSDPSAATGKKRRYFFEPPLLSTWSVRRNIEQLEAIHVVEKTRPLSWVTSNLSLLPGHRFRLSFLEKLKQQVAFDLYGRGFNPIKDKWDGIAPYRYSIAFENCIAPLYFTEKLMDCFVCHTMPFYFGAPDVTKYFPAKSMVQIDPDDPKVFDKIREISNSDLYLERLPFILEAKELTLKKYNIFARLAAHFNEAATRRPMPPEKITLQPVNLDWKAVKRGVK